MSAKYFALLTNIGVAKIANAAALGIKLNITELAVGDGGGTLPTPTPDQTALVNERRRAPINQLSIDPLNDAQIIVEQVIPENVGGWWIKEVGLYDEDGDLVAVSNCPETYKPLLQEGSGRTQIVRMVIIVSNTSSVTVKIDPAVVLATREYVNNIVNAADQKHRDDLNSDIGALSVGYLFEKNATNRTVHDKLSDIVALRDFGGDRNSFDPSFYETLARSRANTLRAPYIGAQLFSLPGQTLKAWRWLDGYKERGALFSFMNVGRPDSDEPVTQVLGISSADGLGNYSDRDFVGGFIQIEAPPALLTTANTIFTANTITSADINNVRQYLRANQIIDVTDALTPSKVFSGLIVSILGNTITIDTAWYLKGGKGTTGTPSVGSAATFIPNTKVWGQNTNVILQPNSQARSIVGYELGLWNNKINDYVGYGFDVVNLGLYGIGNAYQARGKFNIAFNSGPGKKFGFTSQEAAEDGFYSLSDNVGFQSQNSRIHAIQIKNPGQYAYVHQTNENLFVTGMDANGRWQGLRFYSTVTPIGGTITQYSTTTFVTPRSNGEAVYLPAPVGGKIAIVRNLSSLYSLYLSGAYEGGMGGVTLAAKHTIWLQNDGTYWYPIGGYSPN